MKIRCRDESPCVAIVEATFFYARGSRKIHSRRYSVDSSCGDQQIEGAKLPIRLPRYSGMLFDPNLRCLGD
jgi:hypothetical protein